MSHVISSIPLMKQLADMAGISKDRMRRMVLVLDVHDSPVLYVETYLETEEELVPTELEVREGLIVVSTKMPKIGG